MNEIDQKITASLQRVASGVAVENRLGEVVAGEVRLQRPAQSPRQWLIRVAVVALVAAGIGALAIASLDRISGTPTADEPQLPSGGATIASEVVSEVTTDELPPPAEDPLQALVGLWRRVGDVGSVAASTEYLEIDDGVEGGPVILLRELRCTALAGAVELGPKDMRLTEEFLLTSEECDGGQQSGTAEALADCLRDGCAYSVGDELRLEPATGSAVAYERHPRGQLGPLVDQLRGSWSSNTEREGAPQVALEFRAADTGAVTVAIATESCTLTPVEVVVTPGSLATTAAPEDDLTCPVQAEQMALLEVRQCLDAGCSYDAFSELRLILRDARPLAFARDNQS